MLSCLANPHVPHIPTPLQYKAQFWTLCSYLYLSMNWEVNVRTNTLYLYADDSIELCEITSSNCSRYVTAKLSRDLKDVGRSIEYLYEGLGVCVCLGCVDLHPRSCIRENGWFALSELNEHLLSHRSPMKIGGHGHDIVVFSFPSTHSTPCLQVSLEQFDLTKNKMSYYVFSIWVCTVWYYVLTCYSSI